MSDLSLHPLRVAAASFSTKIAAGLPTRGRTGARVERVVSDLITTVALFEQADRRICLVESPLDIRTFPFRLLLKPRLAAVFGIPEDQIILFCDHNHCVPCLSERQANDWEVSSIPPLDADPLNALGEEVLDAIVTAATPLPDRLEPATVSWGTAQETRVSYNRKGHWPDGSTYFIREKERLDLGEDYIGLIDPDADVVTFHNDAGQPLLGLCRFTAHPVTSYHPERMTATGEWSQFAADHLRREFGGDTPVAFLQGCAGNINSRYFLTGDIAKSAELGDLLGESFLQAYRKRQQVAVPELGLDLLDVQVPLAALPSVTDLEAELAEIDAFIANPHLTNTYGAYTCVGLNFPEVLSPRYRAQLVKEIRGWYEWALSMHRENRLPEIPPTLPIRCPLLRFGDLALIGLPFEPFVEIGEHLKAVSPFTKLLPCGYVNESEGYIPHADGVGDREYMSSFYRYSHYNPPFAAPAGDAVTDALRAYAERRA
ncbi:hypothetical protein [Actomonas aquatica]|uniref:Uncharacterized protein n=1 Tax=Actomonas aquatica TaxID=2866162 RepID=A0ABZ1C2U5_9BACT|nr:hypothetical protein [Opitutus sp. WL0086]WRQ85508.1 hypothetical protein K1X11_011915 [Opitutus sp. WL0086]